MFAIDLGTTFSTIAHWDDQRGCRQVVAFDNPPSMPSWVNVAQRPVCTGNDANARHESAVFDAKRVIGQQTITDQCSPQGTKWPFKLVENAKAGAVLMQVPDPKHPESSFTFHPDQVSALITRQLRCYSRKQLGLTAPIERAVITFPAIFNDRQIRPRVRREDRRPAAGRRLPGGHRRRPVRPRPARQDPGRRPLPERPHHGL